MKAISDAVYKQFSQFLEQQCGIVLGDNKQYLVKSRLSPLVARYDCDSMDALVQRAMNGRERDLRIIVVDAMTTNETLWFRDGYPFKLLNDMILPDMKALPRPVKIWSAACSSGQEPYSMSMIAHEFMQRKPGFIKGAQIVGTDISPSMLEHCKQGEYDSLALARGLSPERKRMFFEDCGNNRFRVNAKVKSFVNFRALNLLDSYALMGKFDVIFCRNVLIYFNADVKTKILNQFAQALNPGGYLMLGASESLTGLTDRFEMIRCNPGIVYRLK
ncbi:protein-glutamate O-methyltransferase CheR [Alginatibacterium sediminis]|uniref:protein-glutamate O-methyltransferase n=1 Tax=Alginatibacterium sediminis TaxID=2164068 RepID=A0A420EFY1_9ALTE|nr:protein-glutamate O-methyltransferase CheR [Alginatibacterium sediminis]RKF19621.1 protein-glutamate O-methyltransferase CheR [Alginatibacterium sediminis]